MRNNIGLEYADNVHRRFRFRSKVDTIKFEFRLIRPACRAEIRALVGGSGVDLFCYKLDPSLKMTESEYKANYISDDFTYSLFFRLTIQDPNLLMIQDAVLSVAGVYGLRDVLIKRLDLAFDLVPVRRSMMTESEIESACCEMLDLAKQTMIPLSDEHYWSDDSETFYAGHRQGNRLLAYYKVEDGGNGLPVTERHGRVEMSLCSSTLKRLGLLRFADLVGFDWRLLALKMRFVAGSKAVSRLNSKVTYSVSRMSDRDWSLAA